MPGRRGLRPTQGALILTIFKEIRPYTRPEGHRTYTTTLISKWYNVLTHLCIKSRCVYTHTYMYTYTHCTTLRYTTPHHTTFDCIASPYININIHINNNLNINISIHTAIDVTLHHITTHHITWHYITLHIDMYIYRERGLVGSHLYRDMMFVRTEVTTQQLI